MQILEEHGDEKCHQDLLRMIQDIQRESQQRFRSKAYRLGIPIKL